MENEQVFRCWKHYCGAVLASWLLITPLLAQLTSGNVQGTIYDHFTAELTDQDPKTTTIALASPKVAIDDDLAHAFDWDLVAWKVTMDRLNSPLAGSTAWTHLAGSTIDSPFWGGRGNIAEVTVDGPSGSLQLLALRLYRPTKRGCSYARSQVSGAFRAHPTGTSCLQHFACFRSLRANGGVSEDEGDHASSGQGSTAGESFSLQGFTSADDRSSSVSCC